MKFLNTWLNQEQTGLAGLDIGTGSVKLVALHNDSAGWTITSAAHTVIEPTDNPALHEENTLTAIRKCFQAAGKDVARNVVCGVSGQAVSVRGFNFPALPDNAIEQAVKLEAQQTCALDVGKCALDYQLLATEDDLDFGKKKPLSGYFVAGLQEAIDRKVRLSQLAQTKTVLMDMDSLATLNCISLLPENQTTDIIAAIDVGHSSTTMTILGSNGAPFVRTLSGSSQQVIAALTAKMQLSAAEIRKELFCDASNKTGIIDAELKNTLSKMTTDALETLRFYAIQHNGNKVSRLYLCGGFALAKPFVRLMQQALAIPCTVFNPLDVLQCGDNSEIRNIFSEFGPAMTVAAGLAMRSFNHVHN